MHIRQPFAFAVFLCGVFFSVLKKKGGNKGHLSQPKMICFSLTEVMQSCILFLIMCWKSLKIDLVSA